MKKLSLFSNVVDFLLKKKHWFILFLAVVTLKVLAPTTFLILVLAAGFYLIFDPLVTNLSRLTRSNTLALAIFTVLLVALLIFSSAYILPKLIKQTGDFIKNFPQIQKLVLDRTAQLQTRLSPVEEVFSSISNVSFNELIRRYLADWGKSLVTFFDHLIRSLSKIVTFLFHLLIALIASIYLLSEKKAILPKLRAYFAKSSSKREKRFLELALQQLIAYFNGLLILSGIAFISTWLVLGLLGIKFSLLLALWTGLMQMIPIFGLILALVLILIIAWIQSPSLILPVLIYFVVMEFALSHILAPQILGKTTNFSPLAIFLVLLIGAETFGLWGMILGVPVVSLIVLGWKSSKY